MGLDVGEIERESQGGQAGCEQSPAAEILGIRDRSMRRWRERYEEDCLTLSVGNIPVPTSDPLSALIFHERSLPLG
jgi:hypothetical protein